MPAGHNCQWFAWLQSYSGSSHRNNCVRWGMCTHVSVAKVRSLELKLCCAWLQQFGLVTPQAALHQSCWTKIQFRCLLLCRHIVVAHFKSNACK